MNPLEPRADSKPRVPAGILLKPGNRPFGPRLAYVIAGHHASLADGSQLFPERLKRPINQWRAAAQAAGVPLDLPLPTPPLQRPDAGDDGMAFMLRYFFSCLVDADCLATEAFKRVVSSIAHPGACAEDAPAILSRPRR